jgi:prophage regulatory protein
MNHRVFTPGLGGPSPIRPLDLSEVCARIRLKRSATLSRGDPKSKYFDPTFPRPFRYGERSRKLYWIEAEVEAWLMAKATRARAGPPP